MNSNKTDIMAMVNLARKYYEPYAFVTYSLLTGKFYPPYIQEYMKQGMDKEEIEERIADFQKNYNNDNFFIEYITEKYEDKLVGFLIKCNPKLNLGNNKGGQIEVILVAPEYRGKGIGKKMMNEAIKRFNKNGRNEIKVSSEFETTGFYEKFGFNERFGLIEAIEKISSSLVDMYMIPKEDDNEEKIVFKGWKNEMIEGWSNVE